MDAPTPVQAQQRVDDIQAFRREIQRLDAAGVYRATDEQQSRINAFHDQLLRDYADRYATDPDSQSRNLSLGMRIASSIGALALSASLVFLFYRLWGFFSETTQSVILIAASAITLTLTGWLHKRDRFGHFCRLSAFIALACFVLNIIVLAQIYNLRSSDMALSTWAALALLLAYGCRSRLLLIAGLGALACFISTRITVWNGWMYGDFLQRPENFFIAAVALFVLPLLIDQRRFGKFAETYRLTGLLALFLPMLALANNARHMSYLSFSADSIENLYQIAGFVIAALLIWWGVRRNWAETFNTSVVFFSIFLYIKLFDWWWEAIPKYLFFFIIGIIALGILWGLSRLRNAMRQESMP